jgi:hypothetical protein
MGLRSTGTRPHLTLHTHITLTLSLSLMPRSTVTPPGYPSPPDVTTCGTRRCHPRLLRTSPRFGHLPSPPPNVSTSVLHCPGRLGRTPPPRSPRATRPDRHRPDLGATPQRPPPTHPCRRPSSSYASQHQPSSLTPSITRLSILGHHGHRGQRVCFFTQQIKALFAMIKVYASSIICSQTQEFKVFVNH